MRFIFLDCFFFEGAHKYPEINLLTSVRISNLRFMIRLGVFVCVGAQEESRTIVVKRTNQLKRKKKQMIGCTVCVDSGNQNDALSSA